MANRSLTTHRTVVLRLKHSTANALAQVGARSNTDLEEVLEDLVEKTYSPDNKTPRERELERQDARPNVDAKSAKEIDRLVERSKEVR